MLHLPRGNSFKYSSLKITYTFKLQYGPKCVIIQGQDYPLVNVSDDGDCFLHCLSILIAGDYSRTKYYRQTICRSILTNWNNWQENVALFHDTRTTYNSYQRMMLQSNGWATNCEIEAASLIVGCHINV